MKHPVQSPSLSGSHLHFTNAEGDPRIERAIRFFEQRFAERVPMKEAARLTLNTIFDMSGHRSKAAYDKRGTRGGGICIHIKKIII
jgi:hypothetical protein